MGGSASTRQTDELEKTEKHAVLSTYDDIWRERLMDRVNEGRDVNGRRANYKFCYDRVNETVIKRCKELETAEKKSCCWDIWMEPKELPDQ